MDIPGDSGLRPPLAYGSLRLSSQVYPQKARNNTKRGQKRLLKTSFAHLFDEKVIIFVPFMQTFDSHSAKNVFAVWSSSKNQNHKRKTIFNTLFGGAHMSFV